MRSIELALGDDSAVRLAGGLAKELERMSVDAAGTSGFLPSIIFRFSAPGAGYPVLSPSLLPLEVARSSTPLVSSFDVSRLVVSLQEDYILQ